MADSMNDNAVPEQHPSTLCAYFDKFPELKDKKLGDMVEMKVKGKIVELEAPSQDEKGMAVMEITNGDMTMEDMQTMPVKELRKKLPVKDEEANY